MDDETEPTDSARRGAPFPAHAAAASPTAKRPARGGGWRAEKKERTRRILVDVALELFERHGYDATSVEEVAAAGGVSPRTVFRYFPAKHDLLFADGGRAIGVLSEAVTSRPAGESNCQVLRAMAVEHANVMADATMQRRSSVIARNPGLRAHALVFREAMGIAIGDALAERDDSLDRSIARLYGQVAAVALGRAIVIWIEQGADGNLVDVTEHVFDSLRELVA
jgi:AcrR family transcriptional regulator